MFDGIDLSKINLNDVMGQVQEMADKAKEENANTNLYSKSWWRNGVNFNQWKL